MVSPVHLLSALVVGLLAWLGPCAAVEIDWCYQPTVNGSPTNAITVPCKETVTFKWCGRGMHDLVEINTGGDICDLSNVLPNAPDNVGYHVFHTKDITQDKAGVRRFHCTPHCLRTGQHIAITFTCPDAVEAAKAAPASPPPPPPVPSPPSPIPDASTTRSTSSPSPAKSPTPAKKPSSGARKPSPKKSPGPKRPSGRRQAMAQH